MIGQAVFQAHAIVVVGPVQDGAVGGRGHRRFGAQGLEDRAAGAAVVKGDQAVGVGLQPGVGRALPADAADFRLKKNLLVRKAHPTFFCMHPTRLATSCQCHPDIQLEAFVASVTRVIDSLKHSLFADVDQVFHYSQELDQQLKMVFHPPPSIGKHNQKEQHQHFYHK